MDGTLRGPDKLFRLIEFSLRALGVHEAKEVLFIADGATWIWNRVTELWRRLGLVGVVRCRELEESKVRIGPANETTCCGTLAPGV